VLERLIASTGGSEDVGRKNSASAFPDPFYELQECRVTGQHMSPLTPCVTSPDHE